MSVFLTGIYSRLINDLTLTALLSTYGASKGIFSTVPVPEDARPPYIVINLVNDQPHDSKATRGREQVWDIGCYAAETGSLSALETIAERVRTLFHRHILTVTGYTTIIAEASITPGVNDNQIYGLIVTIRLVMEAS